jgi:glycosyltransferase involved in cell wall biosynthesis
MFPLITETYIGDHAEALALAGAHVAFSREEQALVPLPVRREVFSSLETAVRRFGPDVIMVNWQSFALTQLERLSSLDVPFAFRGHSFDFDPVTLTAIRDHPNCIGLWLYPWQAKQVEGAFPLKPLFPSGTELPPAAAHRDLVLSVSAGLPKRKWDLLLEALDLVPELKGHFVVGVTNGHGVAPEKLAERLLRCAHPPVLEMNLPRAEVFDRLSHAAALVYTLDASVPFGWPMSIVEALCSGVCVILPDREEARELDLPRFRGYRTAEDIAGHITEIFRGGTDIDAERAANIAFGHREFCSESAAAQFLHELELGVRRWQAERGSPIRES